MQLDGRKFENLEEIHFLAKGHNKSEKNHTYLHRKYEHTQSTEADI